MINSTEIAFRVYRDAQNACDFRIHDYVQILHETRHGEGGWPGSWTREMDRTVGEVGRICKICSDGIIVDFKDTIRDMSTPHWLYPYFVFQKAERPEPNLEKGDPVLVRDHECNYWQYDVFRQRNWNSDSKYICEKRSWKECVPFKGYEYLVGSKKNV